MSLTHDRSSEKRRLHAVGQETSQPFSQAARESFALIRSVLAAQYMSLVVKKSGLGDCDLLREPRPQNLRPVFPPGRASPPAWTVAHNFEAQLRPSAPDPQRFLDGGHTAALPFIVRRPN